MEVDNAAKKERYLFATIIVLALLLGIFIGVYYNKSPVTHTQTQTVNINTDSKEDKVNLNTATEKVLSSLPGIGEKKAKKIIKYRQENGSFKSINDLLNVEGIGKETIDNIKDKVVI